MRQTKYAAARPKDLGVKAISSLGVRSPWYLLKAVKSRVKETSAVRLPVASKKEHSYKNFEKESTFFQETM